MRADLHTHSVYSDGKFFPDELAKIAKTKGVELLSITDHDNFAGEAQKRAAAREAGLVYCTGVELSAYEGQIKLHTTGYGFDPFLPRCRDYQKRLTQGSYERMYDVLFRLKKYKGYTLTDKEVWAQQEIAGSPVHTMHVVKALLAKGYYASVGEAFADCFIPNLPTYSFVCRLTPEEAIEIIHSLGGIACIAHPGRIYLPPDEKEKTVRRLKDMGLDGMECVYSSHTAEETDYFVRLADELGLLVSGGSDFHADGGKRQVGSPSFEPSEEFLRAARIAK